MHMTALLHGMLQKLIFVRNNHEREFQVPEHIDDPMLGRFIQTRSGFIEEEHLRLHGQDSGQGDKLLFAPGKLNK